MSVNVCLYVLRCSYIGCINSVQFSSVTQSCLTLCNPMNHSKTGLPVHHQLWEFTETHAYWVGDATNHLILCHSLILLPSVFPSIRMSSNESALRIRWLKYWSFSFNISPSNEYLGLISFRMDWFDLLAVQGTLKSLLQHHSSKASVLQCSAFFMVQLSHPYMTTGNTQLWLSTPLSAKILSLTRSQLIAQSPVSIQWLPTKHKERTQNRWEHNVFNSVASFQMAKSCD